MAYISLDKTWNVISCIVDPTIYTTVADQNKRVIYLLKEAFVTAGWVVTQSSDSINVGSSDNLPADRWIDYSKLIWAINLTAHSWVVLKNTVIGTNFSVCIDCNYASSSTWLITITVSYGGYQTGTIQNRPVVNTNCVEHTFASIIHGYSNFVANRGCAILYSTDGECFRVFTSYAGNGLNVCANSGFIMLFEKLKNPTSILGYNYVAIVSSCSGNANRGFSYLNLCISTSDAIRSEIGGIGTPCAIATLGVGTDGALGNSIVGKNSPDYDGYYMLTECYAASLFTAYPGVLGQFYDMYFAPINIPEGIYFQTTTGDSGLVKFGQGAFGCSGNKISIP
jgi:hypothetical protein